MFQMALEGNTCCAIAKELEREQVLTPRAYVMVHYGKYARGERQRHPYSWSEITVEHILRNPVYLGKMACQKGSTRSFKDKRRIDKPEDEWVIVENTHEPLVDQATFDTVRERLKVKKPISTFSPENIYRGLLFCGECHTRMVFSVAKPDSGRSSSFCCNKYRRYGAKECSVHHITLNALNDIVLGDIRRHASLASANKDLYAEYLANVSERERDGERLSWQKELENSQRRLDELDMLIQRLYEDSVFGRIPVGRYEIMSASYEKESEKLKERVAELHDSISAWEKRSRGAGQFAELVARYADITELTPELLNTLIEKIVIHEREIVDGKPVVRLEIYYRFIGNVGDNNGDDLMVKRRHIRYRSVP